MANYTKGFKIKVAERYLERRDGYRSLAKEFWIIHEQTIYDMVASKWALGKRSFLYTTSHSLAFKTGSIKDMATNRLSEVEAP